MDALPALGTTASHRHASQYDRRGTSRDELPEPTHDFMALTERRRSEVSWAVQLLTILLAGAFSLGVARSELSGKADFGERASDSVLPRSQRHRRRNKSDLHRFGDLPLTGVTHPLVTRAAWSGIQTRSAPRKPRAA